MLKQAGTVGKSGYFIPFLVIVLLFSCFQSFIVLGSSSYIPAAPTGVSEGYVGVEYEFLIYSGTIGSYWIFDWGDGSTSDWIKVNQAGMYITQSHVWYEIGDYEVKVKRKDIYNVESKWSDALIVTVDISSDLDMGDGIPDEPSLDDKFPVDSNDDDFLDDFLTVDISGITHYLIDDDEDGEFELFYNSNSGNINSLGKNDEGFYLIDINSDNKWDYSYDIINGIMPVEEKQSFVFSLIFIILTVAIAVIIVLFILFKTGILYVYEEEITDEK